jgi:hypothetical protein
MSMARKPLDQIEFRKGTTIGKIKELMAHHETKAVAEEIYQRFMERFLIPLKSVPTTQSHGFFTMANCCLLIEAIQRYRQGMRDETRGEKDDLYANFFDDYPRFTLGRAQAKTLYHTLRSGVLHLGETKGWLIHRKSPIIDFEDKTINATKFRNELERSLRDYRDTLKKKKWTSREWQNVVIRLHGFFHYSDLNYEPQTKK